MSLHVSLPVYKASYDLLLVIFQFTKEFNREYKYTVGDSLKNETMSLLLSIYRANATMDHNRRQILQTAREHVEVIRLLVRVMKDLKQINVRKFVQVNEKIESISRQLTAWQKTRLT